MSTGFTEGGAAMTKGFGFIGGAASKVRASKARASEGHPAARHGLST